MGRYARSVGVLAGLVGLAASASVASAHVDYVVEDPETAIEAAAFVVETLSAPGNAALVGAGGVGALAAAGGYLRVRPLATDLAAFRTAMDGYRDLVPWLLRISVGFPLVGAGFSGYLFSPAVPVEARLAQVGIGFLLLFGLATRATALAGLVVYGVALAAHPGVLLANEFVPGFLAIALVGPGSPSADEVLASVASVEGTVYGRVDPVHELAGWVAARVEPHVDLASTVVRVGLGLNFVYLGVTQKLMDPARALAVVEKYDLTAVVPVDPALWVVGAGLAEAALGLALVLGAFTRASAVAALGVFTLTLFGLPDDPVLAHLALFGLASSVLITGGDRHSLDARLSVLGGRTGREEGGSPG